MKIDREKIIRIAEACGGVSAFTEAIKRIKIPFEIEEYIEIDSHAVDSFNAMNNTKFVSQDVRTWDKNIKNIDIFMHATPCTSVSIAGKQKGADEGSGTESSIIWDDVRIISKVKPKICIWENVANFTVKRHRHNFDKYLKQMSELGYSNSWKILNATEFGVPQNRRRVFVVSKLKDEQFEFPKPMKLEKTLYDLLDEDYDASQVVLTEKELKMVKDFGATYSFGGSIVKGNIYPTITAGYGKSSGNSGKIKCKDGYRILTPQEAWRLMGFSEEAFEKASQVNSSRQLYKQARKFNCSRCINSDIKKTFQYKRY